MTHDALKLARAALDDDSEGDSDLVRSAVASSTASIET